MTSRAATTSQWPEPSKGADILKRILIFNSVWLQTICPSWRKGFNSSTMIVAFVGYVVDLMCFWYLFWAFLSCWCTVLFKVSSLKCMGLLTFKRDFSDGVFECKGQMRVHFCLELCEKFHHIWPLLFGSLSIFYQYHPEID